MRNSFILALTLTASLSACGGQRSAGPEAAAPGVNTLIPERSGGLFAQRRAALAAIDLTSSMDQITDLRVEQVPGGVIIRATGLDRYTTSYAAQLRPVTLDETPQNGILAYTFRRIVPQGAQPGGAAAAREITVGRFVSDQALQGVRTIRVEAASNSRTARR